MSRLRCKAYCAVIVVFAFSSSSQGQSLEQMLKQAQKGVEAQKKQSAEAVRRQFERAKKLYDRGKFAEAKPLFQQVAQRKEVLGFFDRLSLSRYIRRVDRKLAAQGKPAQTARTSPTLSELAQIEAEAKRGMQLQAFAKAEAMYRQGNYEKAKSLFVKVAESKVDLGAQKNEALRAYLQTIDRKITEQQEAKLRAIEAKLDRGFIQSRLMQIRRELQEKRRRQREAISLYEKAVADYKAGRLETAKKKFADVRGRNADIGPERTRQLDRYMTDIERRLRHVYAQRAEQMRLIEQAKALEAQGKPDEAKRLYSKVAASKVDLGQDVNAQLQASMRRVDLVIAERNRVERERQAKALASFKRAEMLFQNRQYRDAQEAFRSLQTDKHLPSPQAEQVAQYMRRIQAEIQRQEAEARRLAQMRTHAREEFAKAKALYKQQKFEQTKAILDDIKASGADIGPEDNAALRQISADVNRKVAAIVAERQMFMDVFEEAVNLRRQGKLVEAKAKFERVARSKVDLGPAVMKRLKDSLSSIDMQIRRAEELRKKMLALFQSGQKALQQQNYADAKRAFTKVAQSNAQLPVGIRKALPGLVRQAEEKLNAQREQMAREARLNLRCAQALCREGSWSDAKPFLQRILAAGTLVGPDLRNKALRQIKDIDLQIARQNKDVAIRDARRRAARRNALKEAAEVAATAEFRYRQGKLDEAEKLFARANAIKAEADLNDALTLMEDRRYGEAETAISKLASSRDVLSASLLKKLDTAAAKLNAIRAQQRDFDRAEQLLRAQKQREAEPLLVAVRNSSVDIGPRRRALLAAYLEEIRDWKAAVARAERLRLEREAKTVEQRFDAAEKLFDNGKLAEAQPAFVAVAKALEREPRLPVSSSVRRATQKYLARIKSTLREQAERKQRREKALQLLASADQLRKQGKLQEALDVLRQVDRRKGDLPPDRVKVLQETTKQVAAALAAKRKEAERQRREIARAYDHALNAWKREDYEKAKPLLQKVAKAAMDIGAGRKKDAQQKLASIDRLIAERRAKEEARKRELAKRRQQLLGEVAQADALLKQGKYDLSEKKFLAIARSGVALGEKADAHVQQTLRRLRARREAVAMYEQGMKAFREEHLDLAKAKLRRALEGRAGLTEKQAAEIEDTLKAIDQRLAAVAKRREELQRKLAEAERAYKAGDYVRADQLLAEHKKNLPYLDDRTATYTKVLLAKLEPKLAKQREEQRRLAENKQRKEMLEKFRSGRKLYDQERFGEALPLLDAVAKSGVKLSWLDKLWMGRHYEDCRRHAQEQAKLRSSLLLKFKRAEALYSEQKYEAAQPLYQEVTKRAKEAGLHDMHQLASTRLASLPKKIEQQRKQRREREAAALLHEAQTAFNNKQFRKALDLLDNLRRNYRDTETFKKHSRKG